MFEAETEFFWIPYHQYLNLFGGDSACALIIDHTRDGEPIYVARTKLSDGLYVPGYAINGVGYFVSILNLNHAFESPEFDVIVGGDMKFRVPSHCLPLAQRFTVATYRGNGIYVGSINIKGSEFSGMVYREQCYVNYQAFYCHTSERAVEKKFLEPPAALLPLLFSCVPCKKCIIGIACILESRRRIYVMRSAPAAPRATCRFTWPAKRLEAMTTTRQDMPSMASDTLCPSPNPISRFRAATLRCSAERTLLFQKMAERKFLPTRVKPKFSIPSAASASMICHFAVQSSTVIVSSVLMIMSKTVGVMRQLSNWKHFNRLSPSNR